MIVSLSYLVNSNCSWYVGECAWITSLLNYEKSPPQPSHFQWPWHYLVAGLSVFQLIILFVFTCTLMSIGLLVSQKITLEVTHSAFNATIHLHRNPINKVPDLLKVLIFTETNNYLWDYCITQCVLYIFALFNAELCRFKTLFHACIIIIINLH